MRDKDMAVFRQYLDQAEAEQKKKYSLENMKQKLGNEPWDCSLISHLYMKNFMGMTRILKSSRGAEVFLSLLEFKHMMCTTLFFKEKTLSEIERVNERLRSEVGYLSKKEDHDSFLDYQDCINMHFFGYVSASYALIQLQTRLQKDYSLDKTAVSKLFEDILEGDCYTCINFLRHKMAHGVFLRFTSKIIVNYNPYNKNIYFVLHEDKVNSLEADSAKDRKGKQYLLDNSCDLNVVITKHFALLNQFYESVYTALFNEYQKEIVQSNEYFRAVITQTEAQGRAIANSVGKELPEIQVSDMDSRTYYLERAFGYRLY